MKRVFALLLVVGSFCAVAGRAADSSSVKGWIWVSDSSCGAKHSKSGSACVKKSIEGGAAPVLVDENNAVWAIENPEAVKGYYGDRVAINGTTDSDKKSVHVDLIAALY